MNDTDLQVSASRVAVATPVSLGSLFTRIKLDAAGGYLPADATGHVAVLFPQLGIVLGSGSRGVGGQLAKDGDSKGSPEQLAEAFGRLSLAGLDGWSLANDVYAPLAIDRSRDTCIDTDYFKDVVADWHWTGPVVPWSSASAFGVNFGVGDVYYDGRRYNRGFGLPVRVVGQ